MKASGIVRRIDELGRVVLPVEMRRSLHIDVGDSLEIFYGSDGILLKKHSPLTAVKDQCELAAKRMYLAFGRPVLFFDATAILAAGGMSLPAYGEDLHELLGKEATYVSELTLGDRIESGVYAPLKVRGDTYGGVFLVHGEREEIDTLVACCTFLQEYLC